MSDEIGDRLRRIRRDLGFKNQAEFAEFIGVSASSIHNYESGKRSPDVDFLARLAEENVDVLYVVTGVPAADKLAPDEMALIDNYRALSVKKRESLSQVAAALNSDTDKSCIGKG